MGAHDDPSDRLQEFPVLGAYERLLTEKNERTLTAARIRQELSRRMLHRCLIEWIRSKAETTGFGMLVEAGLSDCTGEYLVTR